MSSNDEKNLMVDALVQKLSEGGMTDPTDAIQFIKTKFGEERLTMVMEANHMNADQMVCSMIRSAKAKIRSGEPAAREPTAPPKWYNKKSYVGEDGVGEDGEDGEVGVGEVGGGEVGGGRKIFHNETIDPRVVPNIIGRGHTGLKEIARKVVDQTGHTVFINYQIRNGAAWGEFVVSSHCGDAINAACGMLHESEDKFIEAIRRGDLRIRIPPVNHQQHQQQRHQSRNQQRYHQQQQHHQQNQHLDDCGGGCAM